jgi:hypothetical protein
MSKAKELAREIKTYAQAIFNEDRSDIFQFAREVEEFCDAVLSEPEPELKGFIEITYTASDAEIQELIPINSFRIARFNDRCAIIPVMVYGVSSNLYMVKESYDEIKQLIKGAS